MLLLKQKAETIDAATARFRLTPDERQVLLGADKGEGLLLVRGNRIPLQVIASEAEYRLATTNPRDLEDFLSPTRPMKDARSAPEPATTGPAWSVEAVLTSRRHEKPGLPATNGRTHASLG